MGKLRKACANCIKYKLACEAKRPCSRCVLHQCSCIDVERKPRAARRPKRPRTALDGVDDVPATSAPAIVPAAAAASTVTSPKPATNSQGNLPYVPELVLNDNDPLFSSSIENPFMMQSTEASMLPNDFMLNTNNSFLSSVLMLDHDSAAFGAPLMPKVEPSSYGFYDDVAKKTDFTTKLQSFNTMTGAQSFVQGGPANTAAATNKFVIPVPQPLVVVNKEGWSVVDCNLEFAQFLGYSTIAEFNANIDANAVIIPESIGLSKQNFEYFLTAKVNHFERLGMLKSKDGTERTVTLHVDIMDKLMIFTVKEVFDMRPMCFYTRWLKAVAPNAITPCDRVRCQCRVYDYMSNTSQQQQTQPLQQSPIQNPLSLSQILSNPLL